MSIRARSLHTRSIRTRSMLALAGAAVITIAACGSDVPEVTVAPDAAPHTEAPEAPDGGGGPTDGPQPSPTDDTQEPTDDTGDHTGSDDGGSDDDGSDDGGGDDGDGSDGGGGSDSGDSGASGDGAAGTKGNPVPIGQAVDLGPYTVTVDSVQLDGTDFVVAENSYQGEPPEGRQYVVFEIAATYNGTDEDGSAFFDLYWVTESASGTEHSYAGDDEVFCVVSFDDGFPMESVAPGETVSGVECAAVPVEDIDGLTLQISYVMDWGSEPTYFALD